MKYKIYGILTGIGIVFLIWFAIFNLKSEINKKNNKKCRVRIVKPNNEEMIIYANRGDIYYYGNVVIVNATHYVYIESDFICDDN